MAFYSRSVFQKICAISLILSPGMVMADDYLKMLESEAEDVTLDKSGQIQEKSDDDSSSDSITKANWTWNGDLQGDDIPSGLAQDEFATLLKQRFYGTYVFYRKLNSVDQQTVYYHYSKANPANLDLIRQDIMSQLKK